MNDIIIYFENVSKSYRIYKNRPTTLKEKVLNLFLSRNKSEVIRYNVLNNCTFEIKKGETIGIIGENGAGKSTTLKLIAKITYPDQGRIIVKGTVASLLEIGAGFQPDLTGRENVYLYGTILGLSKKYIDQHYTEIVNFSELEDFMDTPVKNYSSGMYMRLAFAVAIHVDPDILLIDEVLAVGDENFQKKCINKIYELRNRGKTILFVSHDMSMIRRLCDRVIFLRRDGNVEIGRPDKMINLYLSSIYKEEKTTKDKVIQSSIGNGEEETLIKPASPDANRWGNRWLEITSVKFYNGMTKEESSVFFTKDDILVRVRIKKNQKVDKAVLGFAVFSDTNVYLADRNCFLDGKVINVINDENTVEFTIKNIPFLKGKYYFTVALYDESCQIPFDHQHQYYQFMVLNNRDQMNTLIDLECDWHF